MHNTITSSIIVVALFATAACAQWSDSADTNLSIGDGTGDQVQPKIAFTSDGGCYISWFSQPGGGYDVRLQRLDANGNELWAHNGILVADRSLGSTQDYGLGVDSTDHALLAFRDDRFGGIRITGVRIAPDGTTFPWGADGVQFGNGSDFVAAPKITALSDGAYGIAWTNNADIMLQRLDADGDILWKTAITETIAALADLRPGELGSMIASWIHSPSFPSPKHLYAQKYAFDGALLWGETPVIVFDGGSLQFGNFPAFDVDGAGGAVFAWYSTSGGLQCSVQHIDADGTELFGHNGSVVSTNTQRARVSPHAQYEDATGDLLVFWTELSANQAQAGVHGQKFDAFGDTVWGDEGVEVVPVGTSDSISSVRSVPTGDGGAEVYFSQAIGGFNDDEIRGAKLDTDGALIWDPAVLTVAARNTGKSRLATTKLTGGDTVIAWQEGVSGSADVLAQNINRDGSLGGGGVEGDLDDDGTVGTTDLLIMLGMWGACPGCPADLNDDDVVDVLDLLALLGLWT